MGTTSMMQALGNKVIIKKRDDKTKMVGDLVIVRHDTHGEINYADVISVGPKCTEVKVGDVVIVINGMGITFEVDNVQYIELPEHEIEAIVTEE